MPHHGASGVQHAPAFLLANRKQWWHPSGPTTAFTSCAVLDSTARGTPGSIACPFLLKLLSYKFSANLGEPSGSWQHLHESSAGFELWHRRASQQCDRCALLWNCMGLVAGATGNQIVHCMKKTVQQNSAANLCQVAQPCSCQAQPHLMIQEWKTSASNLVLWLFGYAHHLCSLPHALMLHA